MFCRRPLASPLLFSIPMRAGVTAWLLTSSACLVPQESRVLQPVPALQNRPPRIIEEQASPARVVHTGNGPGCRLNFSLKVSDPDLGDTLFTRWWAYMSFDPNQFPQNEQIIPPDGSEIRNTSAVWNIDLSGPGNPFPLDGTYAVEALVADGPLIGRNPQPRTVDSTLVTTYAVSYAWVVVVQTGLPCLP
jgi:hypothetical protein